MSKPIAIIAGEPNSISSEIIFKCWKFRNNYIHKPLIIIGNAKLLNLQKNKLKFNLKIKSLKKNFDMNDLNKNYLPVLNVNYSHKVAFKKISSKSNKYIFECFKIAIDLFKNKKILGFINCPVNKETLFKNKYQGITEYLSKKTSSKGNEVMLIYNKKLAVAPLTTHIPIDQVSRKIKKFKILKKIKIINNFYKKNFNKKPKIAILGLNPHNFSQQKKFEEKKIISPAVKALKKSKLNVVGPISPDTSFVNYQKYKFNVIFGMYHDQVLGPFKALFKYDAINITLGLPYLRISPDHGVAENITGKNKARFESLINSIKFFNKIK